MKRKGKKRGRKPLGGIRVILRLPPEDVGILERMMKQTGLKRYELIQNAVRKVYGAGNRRIQ